MGWIHSRIQYIPSLLLIIRHEKKEKRSWQLTEEPVQQDWVERVFGMALYFYANRQHVHPDRLFKNALSPPCQLCGPPCCIRRRQDENYSTLIGLRGRALRPCGWTQLTIDLVCKWEMFESGSVRHRLHHALHPPVCLRQVGSLHSHACFLTEESVWRSATGHDAE